MTNKKEYTIFSKWLAYELRQQGFRIIRTEINPNFPNFNCWVFENNTDLQKKVGKMITFNFACKTKQRIEESRLLKIKENLLKINWPGRMEVLSSKPFVILDACINGTSCRNIIFLDSLAELMACS